MVLVDPLIIFSMELFMGIAHISPVKLMLHTNLPTDNDIYRFVCRVSFLRFLELFVGFLSFSFHLNFQIVGLIFLLSRVFIG